MKHNFSAGPSILPQSVFKEAAEAVVNFAGTGLSILEISHRSPQFSGVIEETKSLIKEILGIGDEWHVLFMTGGASSQFFMTAMNLLKADDHACYIDTGTWSSKAIKEATRLGNVSVAASSSDKNYTYIPKNPALPADCKYLHITSNNTIYGTQYHEWPEASCPLVADMSSDIFSKPVDMSRFGLIYAGAQKNVGPAGLTIVLARDSFLHNLNEDLPTMLSYKTFVAKDSMFNTPPVFPIYVATLNLRWLKAQGGLEAMAARNDAKAELLYGEIDDNPMFRGVVDPGDRSNMNATFVLEDPSLEDDFLARCDAAGISGIKGHRSVGGFRASMYNAMGIESVRALTQVMHEFALAHGKAQPAL